jgi:hypothetical protein
MAEHSDLVQHLRENADMMRDGHQRNLTKLWHSEVVTNAAKDADDAADLIDALVKALERATMLLAIAGPHIMDECNHVNFTYDGSTADNYGFGTDCENAIERARAALALCEQEGGNHG